MPAASETDWIILFRIMVIPLVRPEDSVLPPCGGRARIAVGR